MNNLLIIPDAMRHASDGDKLLAHLLICKAFSREWKCESFDERAERENLTTQTPFKWWVDSLRQTGLRRRDSESKATITATKERLASYGCFEFVESYYAGAGGFCKATRLLFGRNDWVFAPTKHEFKSTGFAHGCELLPAVETLVSFLPSFSFDNRLIHFLKSVKDNSNESNSFATSVLKVLNGDIWWRLHWIGRFYHSVLNVPAASRHWMLLDGEQVEEIDLKSCQPTLLAHHLHQLSGSDQMLEFKQLASSGTIYDEIASTIGITRGEAKLEMLRLINQRPHRHYTNQTWKYFKKRFPEVCDHLASMKTEDHRDVGFLLTKLEANLMFNHIVPELFKDCTKFTTIHDCVLVKRSELKQAKAAFERGIKASRIEIGYKVGKSEVDYGKYPWLKPLTPLF